jgi:hypothetical protein
MKFEDYVTMTYLLEIFNIDKNFHNYIEKDGMWKFEVDDQWYGFHIEDMMDEFHIIYGRLNDKNSSKLNLRPLAEYDNNPDTPKAKSLKHTLEVMNIVISLLYKFVKEKQPKMFSFLTFGKLADIYSKIYTLFKSDQLFVNYETRFYTIEKDGIQGRWYTFITRELYERSKLYSYDLSYILEKYGIDDK